ncbi:MAG: alpha/beta hydrolase [Acidimicrobiales bacterium]
MDTVDPEADRVAPASVEMAGTIGARGGGSASREPGAWKARYGSRRLYDRRLNRRDERWPLPARMLAALFRHPGAVLSTLGEQQPVEQDGRQLHRSVQAMLALTGRVGPRRALGGSEEVDPSVMRAELRRLTAMSMPIRTDVHVTGRRIPGPEGAADIPIRVYRQFGRGMSIPGSSRPGPPVIVYFHGGGWVVGDLDTHDASCRMLAAASGCMVVSAGYRLAPEWPFPAAVDDAKAVYAWVRERAGELGADPRRVGVMGDSAGGNLAAVVSQLSAKGSLPAPTAQCLVYPALDFRLGTASIRDCGDGFFLTREAIEYYRRTYVPSERDWLDPRASPLLAPDLGALPPTLVVTAGFDPLRDEGEAYAKALATAGVPVVHRCCDDQVHGFMGMGFIDDTYALATEVCEAMGRLMRRSGHFDSPDHVVR